MTTRVIPDPSALGWELDPNTGRWEWGGSDGGSSGGGGGSGGSIQAIASGELSTGDTVIVNADGTVSVVGGPSISAALGEPIKWSDEDVDFMVAAYDPAKNIVLIAFQASVPNLNAAMVVGDMSGSTITFRALTKIENTGPTSSTIGLCSIGDGQFVIAYADGGKLGYAHVISIDDDIDIIDVGDAFNFANVPDGAGAIEVEYDLDSDKVVCVYRKQLGNRSGVGKVFIIDRANKTIQEGAESYLDSSFSNPSLTYDPLQKKLLCVYTGPSSYLTAIVLDVSGTSVSQTGPTIINSNSSSYLASTYDASAGQHVVVFCNENGSSNPGFSVCLEVEFGIIIGDFSPINSTYSKFFSISYDSIREKVFALYQDAGTKLLVAVYGEVTGAKCNWETPATTTQTQYEAFSSQVDPDSHNMWVFGRNFDQSEGNAWDFIPAYIDTNLTGTNYIGTSSADYSAGASATIQTVGSVSNGQSGLTAGLGYYVQPDGSLATVGDVFAGTAISTTSLIVKG